MTSFRFGALHGFPNENIWSDLIHNAKAMLRWIQDRLDSYLDSLASQAVIKSVQEVLQFLMGILRFAELINYKLILDI